MRFVTFRSDNGARCGLVVGPAVIDVWSGLAARSKEVPAGSAGLEDFLALPGWRQLAGELQEHVEPTLALEDLDLGSIVVRPRNVFVVAANSRSHLAEAGEHTKSMAPVRPVVLAKSPNALNGPKDPVVHPQQTVKLDYEAELGVIIGATCRNVPQKDARQVVAGYTVANDVSARDYQLSEWEENTFYRTHYLGKSFDGFCPCGPVMVTTDEAPDIERHVVRCWVNGELRQKEPITDLIFSIDEIVSFISSVVTLSPGDLILTGTPAGVGAFLDPPGFLAAGDVVRCEIDGLGAIENPIIADDAQVLLGTER